MGWSGSPSSTWISTHPVFDFSGQEGPYFRMLLARLRELSTLKLEEFYQSRSTTLRIHRIDFRDRRVAVSGFGVPGNFEADRHGWQFALTANAHGRVHGFFVGETFYIRWLDPEHNMYPGN